MHIARHARIPSSSPTPVLALTLTIPNRLSLLLLPPAGIACFLGSHATLALAAAAVVRTSTGTPLTPSFRPPRSSSPPCKEARRSVRLTCRLSWEFCATRYSSTGSTIPYRSLCLPLSPHLALVRMCRSAVCQPQAKPWSAMSRKSVRSGSTTPV
eukprot:5906403-Pleurochrysis_carterae.AAC.1